MRIGVVIPYYQREGGILARALRSVAAQELGAGDQVEVVVVDDASPAAVEPEVAAVPMPPATTVTVLHQPNGGPGAARNRGLEHLERVGADIVAFLDSDDQWRPRHLAEAMAALGVAHDLYFCSNRRTHIEPVADDPDDREFERLRRPGEEGVTWLGNGGRDASLIGVEPGRLLEGYLRAYMSQTSTVVMTGALARGKRFDPGLRGAGEDHMFWIDLALAGARTAVSSSVNVECGSGVNIYYSALDFGSPRMVDRIGYLLLLWRGISRKLGPLGRPAAQDKVTRFRRAYSYLLLRAVLRGQRPSLPLLLRVAREDPLFLPALPLRVLSILPRRMQEASTW